MSNTNEIRGEQSGSPRLGLLQLEMRVNTTDKKLIQNLRHCKSLNLPKVRYAEPNDRTLAICGSGPSLRNTYSTIPKGMDVMALNGANSYLVQKGIVPKYFAMLDSRDCNSNFFTFLCPETIALLASQCHSTSFAEVEVCKKRGIFHLSTPTTMKEFPDEELYIGGGGTIGLTSLGLALALGYRSVLLLGFDSSYDGDRHHVVDQPQNDSEEVIDVWVKDRKYIASRAMAAQTMDFFPFLSAIRAACPEFDIRFAGSGLFYDFISTNNHESTRERELSKYAQAYLEEDYGMTKERYDGIVRLISDIQGVSYLDVSTGRGETLEIARSHGFTVVSGTETVDALLNEHVGYGVLPNLSIPDKSYDVVSLFEVIEHLVPEDVEPALLELTRIAKKHVLISAAVRDCYIGGVNLHPSARPVEEWQKLFTQVWGAKVRQMHNLGGSPSWRVDL